MASDGQIVFEITSDDSKLKQNIRQTTSTIQTESKKWEKAGTDAAEQTAGAWKKAITSISVAMVAAKVAQALKEWGSAAIEAASNLQEVQNVVDTVFGDNASKIETWAKQAGKQFGLTETQAKKFTSTLGAMMKSSGLDGDEIVSMSTDLAGLAADMASFYNLDFDTAFQKIRSGISGETEPLKQLGINMSTANLNAFALQQGLKKTFDQMSQGEQTMLRYQYIMQATADAQGDFSKTADGYANAQRRISTALETINTNVGGFLLQTIEPFVSGIAGALEKLTATPEETLFDKINKIDLDTAEKVRQIEETASKAQNLIDKLDVISKTDAGTALQRMAEGANKLDSGSPKTWEAMATALKNVDGLSNIFGENGNAGENIKSLAEALSGSDVNTSKAEAWKKFLGALSDNADAVSKLTGKSAEETKAWLQGIADAADDLDQSDADAWDSLFTTLTSGLSVTEDGQKFAANISALATGANKLDSSAPGTWKSIFNALKDVNGLSNIFSNSNAGKNVEDLAAALSGADVNTDKAQAWQIFLGALTENADAVSKLTGTSVDETKKWLEGLSEAVNSIDANDADAWNKLLTTLVSGFGTGTPEGQRFMEGLASQFLALGSESDAATAGLKSLGYGTDEIAEKQEEWLKTCKQLVQTIPGLSSVINTETGEVTGGIGAISKYVEEWKTAQEKLVYWKAYYAKQAAQEELQGQLYSLEIEAGGKEVAVKRAREALKNIYGTIFDEEGKIIQEFGQGKMDMDTLDQNYDKVKADFEHYNILLGEQQKAEKKYTDAVAQNTAVTQQNADEQQYLIDKFGELTEEELNASDAADEFGGKTASAWQTATSDVRDAIKAVADYYEKMRDETEKTIDKVVGGFDKVKYAGDNARKKSSEYASKEQEALKKYDSVLKKWRGADGSVDLKKMQDNWGKLTKKEQEAYNELAKIHNKQTEINETLSEYSTEGMKGSLQGQLEYMTNYLANLETLKSWGLSKELIAALSDGSAESAEYLAGLVEGGKEGAEQVDALYKQVQEEKKGFVDTLTQQKLEVDKTYDALVAKAKESIKEMDLGEESAAAMGNTVSGIAQGIKSHVGEVSAAVDDIEAQLKRLSGWKINISLGAFGSFGASIDGEHETGLNFVPFDGYLASLHEGEGILTAEENRIWQRFKNGQPSQGIDYDMLGGAMRENIHAGGNVYLDGRTVGRVISDQQGKSFRALERSGWQG